MILTFLLLCLSISLKIVALTARVGLNAAVATADVASKAAIEGTATATGSETSATDRQPSGQSSSQPAPSMHSSASS